MINKTTLTLTRDNLAAITVKIKYKPSITIGLIIGAQIIRFGCWIAGVSCEFKK